MMKKTVLLRWVQVAGWVLAGAGVITLLAAAIRNTSEQRCTGLAIHIEGANNHVFVDKQDILHALNQYIDGSAEGQPLSAFNLQSLERDLAKNIWVKQVQLFFDNNRLLQIHVTEREPVARVFNVSGTSFYIDSSITQLPLSEKLSARLPVFTGFPSDKAVLAHTDSALLRDIATLSRAIQNDSFMMALVEQIDITPERNFEIVPKVGEGVIGWGDASDSEAKISKLKLFYSQIMTRCGWNYYSRLNLQYKGQIVARRKGAEDIAADSLRTVQLMQSIARTAEAHASDSLQTIYPDNEQNSTHVSLIEQSLQRDEQPDGKAEGGFNPLPVKAIPLNRPAVPAGVTAEKKPAPSNTPVKAVSTTVKPKAKSVPVKASLSKPVKKPAATVQNDY